MARILTAGVHTHTCDTTHQVGFVLILHSRPIYDRYVCAGHHSGHKCKDRLEFITITKKKVLVFAPIERTRSAYEYQVLALGTYFTWHACVHITWGHDFASLFNNIRLALLIV